jgi:hypothetical protein
MTFEEALKKKQEIGESIMNVDMKMWVFVTPELDEDFHKYCTYYRSHRKTDEMAKLFSSNGKFGVHGLFTDTVNVYHKKLS